MRDTFFAAWVELHGEQRWFSFIEDECDDAPVLFERREDLVLCVRSYHPAMTLRKVVPISVKRPDLVKTDA